MKSAARPPRKPIIIYILFECYSNLKIILLKPKEPLEKTLKMKLSIKLIIPIVVFPFFAFAQITIAPKDAGKYVGERVTVCGKTSGALQLETGNIQSTFINMGTASASNLVNIVISNDDRKNFQYKPEEFLVNKNVCVTGKVVEINGKAEIILKSL